MPFTNPSILQFKTQFVRDFRYGTDINTTVIDPDIAYAFQMTNLTPGNALQCLVCDQGTYTVLYNLFAAHYLVLNIRSSSQGLNGQYNFMQASKGAGQVNEAFSIPQRVLDNPLWAQFYKTNYGAQAMQMLLPQLAGQVGIAYGMTTVT